MKRPMQIFRLLCAVGIVCSVIAWALPVSAKPYHFKRYLDDWTKNFIVEQVSELGMDADGFVKVRYSRQFSSSDAKAITRIRNEWYEVILKSDKRWPTDGKRLHYDEWGPSNWTRADGVHEIEVGSVYCLPYSFIATVCALPLIWWAAALVWKRVQMRRE
jgi:hypothetical protein